MLVQSPVLKVWMFRGSWNTYLYTRWFIVFDELGVHVEGKDIQACHCLKDNDRDIIKLSNEKDNLQVLRVKKDLKSLNPTELDLPEGMIIFINRVFVPIIMICGRNAKK